MAGGAKGADLVDPASLEPTAGAPSDALVELLSGARDAEVASAVASDAETVLCVPGALRATGELVHLEGAAHAHEVVRREAARARRVHEGELGVERGPPSFARDDLVPRANVRIRGRRRSQPEDERADPEKRASADDRHAAATADVGDGRVGELGEPLGLERLVGVDAVDEVMRRRRALGRRGLTRADVEAAVDLDAVGSDDLAAKPVGEADGELGLAARGRADNDKELVRGRRRSMSRQAARRFGPDRVGASFFRPAWFIAGRRASRARSSRCA